MPVSTYIERARDGSITVWCSDHDPMQRMKGMHGICLHPGRALVEVRVRLYNRTPFTQTFLWWANVAARVHEKYQSFFPADAGFVADHAKRAITSFPLSDGSYYGVDYEHRARNGVPAEEAPSQFVPDGSYPPNDLTWYANIPVPTSYMIAGTGQDFFGGYDHNASAGVVHVANHHISPGKKQWTWGNHEFGYAWDRNLTDYDGPYIELMAGVYTDNQPDFSYLSPWETKSFTQSWYPIRAIGVPVVANRDAALSVRTEPGVLRIGVCVTAPLEEATIVLRINGTETARWHRRLTVAEPALIDTLFTHHEDRPDLVVSVHAGPRLLIEYNSAQIQPASMPVTAKEPKAPEDVDSVEELYLIGLHLEQYRHATRMPETYWAEGLRRDPNDSRLRNAMGLWHLRRGEFEQAARYFEAAITRLTSLNPNPRDGEAYYNLGLALRYQGQDKKAYDAFYKATWNAAWRAPAYFALAECDAASQNWNTAVEHLQRSLRADADNLNARNLLSIVLRKSGDRPGADVALTEVLEPDPLDITARWQRGIPPANGQECLDIALDLIRAGLFEEACGALGAADLNAQDGSVPMILFTLAYVEEKLASSTALQTLDRAAGCSVAYCFPSRIEEIIILEWAHTKSPVMWMPSYLLGNLLYDRRRYEEAIQHWETAANLNPAFATVHRNLGIAYFNVRRDEDRALKSFEAAFAASRDDARVLYERDQLWKRSARSAEERLDELLKYPALVEARDDLSVEVATLLNHVDRPDEALRLMLSRRFQPWEGGEGLALGQYVRARLLLGRGSLAQADFESARDHFLAALQPPQNLSEAKHLLANQSDIYFWLAESFHRGGDDASARQWWLRAARQKGDFQQMSVQNVSDMIFWTGLALDRLGEKDMAVALFSRIYDYSVELEQTQPKVDYFATSLPDMLLFKEDLGERNRINALFLRAQALIGLSRTAESHKMIEQVINLDSSHAGATDLLKQLASLNVGPAR
jgi:tetratricopeptide (TPR) repeat protein